MVANNDWNAPQKVDNPQPPHPDATSRDAPALDGHALDTPVLDAPTRDGNSLDASSLGTVPLDATPLDATSLDATPLDASPLDATPFQAACFPHIVDMILSYAPYDVLLSFRATSKNFKKRVDRMMLHHVSAHDDREPGMMDFDQELVPFGNVILTKREQRRIPALFSSQPELLRYIHVLDGPGDTALHVFPLEAEQTLQPTWSRNKASQDRFLRTWHGPTRVYFTHNPSIDSQTAYVLHRHDPEKLVINLGHDWCLVPRHEASKFPQLGGPRVGTAAFHVVFIHKWKQDDSSDKQCVASTSWSLAHVVPKTCWMTWLRRQAPTTLVGFSPQCLAPARDQDTQPPSADEALEVFKQDIARVIDSCDPVDNRRPTKDEIHSFIAQIEFVDYETYRRRVGEEAYRMETVWEHGS